MGIFVDTNFYISLIDPHDFNYDRSLELLKDLKTGKYGRIYTSIYVMAESATLLSVRIKNQAPPYDLMEDLFIGKTQFALMLRSSENDEKEAWILFKKINTNRKLKIISFVDCTNIIFCKKYQCDNILSFDRHFDGIINRIL